MTLDTFLALHPASVIIEITGTKGSTPRETGTFMAVSQDAIWGTIGGGQFEYMAIANARTMLAGHEAAEWMDIPLGPEIGQCCGGRTQLRIRPATPELIEDLHQRMQEETATLPQIWVFGGGHVGVALAQALRLLPLITTVVETRDDELKHFPVDVTKRLSAMPEALVGEIAPGAAVVILTHDHALDFLIAREALARNDFAYVGMIGSATKRATFSSWLSREGVGEKEWLNRLTMPIGGRSVKDKRPEVIAAMTAAEVLTALWGYRGQTASSR